LYYSGSGPAKGPLRERDVPGSMAIFRAHGSYMPAGQAYSLGPDVDGHAEFMLAVDFRLTESRWLLIDRQFARALETGG
jgi:hypothetical protein